MSDIYVLPDGRLTVRGLALLYGTDPASIRKVFGYGPFTMGPPPLDGRTVPAVWEKTADVRIKEAKGATGKTDWSSILAFLADKD